ncbi:MAG: sporulation and cell division protein SsgA [Frankiales bacterium]|jgi:hypothetical protein|nr:sporulation and cell division protein SsgA [Frankiales bacterium]
MTTRPTSVSSELQFRLVVPGTSSLPVRAELRYDVLDPYAVSVAFFTGSPQGTEDVVEWTFARQLLGDGVARASGEGDVQVWPSAVGGDAVVCLSLSSPSGRALFEVPLRALVDFLSRTYATVPTGCESDHVDLDAELALLLWAEPET